MCCWRSIRLLFKSHEHCASVLGYTSPIKAFKPSCAVITWKVIAWEAWIITTSVIYTNASDTHTHTHRHKAYLAVHIHVARKQTFPWSFFFYYFNNIVYFHYSDFKGCIGGWKKKRKTKLFTDISNIHTHRHKCMSLPSAGLHRHRRKRKELINYSLALTNQMNAWRN